MKKSSTQLKHIKLIGMSVFVALSLALAGCSDSLTGPGEGGVGGIDSIALSNITSTIPPKATTFNIRTLAQFQNFVNDAAVNHDSIGNLLVSLDVSSITSDPAFIPIGGIGTAEARGTGFIGTFNGGGNTLTINVNRSESYVGLFGINNGTVQNLTVAGTVTATYDGTHEINYVGGVVAYNDIGIKGVGGVIQNVISSVTVNAVNDNIRAIGGIAGFNGLDAYTEDSPHYKEDWQQGGIIQYCRNEGAVSGGNSKIGGIVGENAYQVTQCSNRATITCVKTIDGWPGVGGIVGRNGNNNDATEEGTIESCYNWGLIVDATTADTSQNAYGGITGWNNERSIVNNSYTTGQFDPGKGQKNPIIGRVDLPAGTSVNCYSLNTIYANDPGEPELTGTRLSDETMRSPAFAQLLGYPYEYTGIGYPILIWE
jgi:hypothetical protein